VGEICGTYFTHVWPKIVCAVYRSLVIMSFILCKQAVVKLTMMLGGWNINVKKSLQRVVTSMFIQESVESRHVGVLAFKMFPVCP
jgi:hypothetical protein